MKIIEAKVLLDQISLPYQDWQWKEVKGDNFEYTLQTFPRVVIWPYVFNGLRSSGNTYKKLQKFQISVYSKHPSEPKVFELENLLIKNGLDIEIYQEFNEKDGIFHYYMGIDGER